jgi:hypothetical protein
VCNKFLEAGNRRFRLGVYVIRKSGSQEAVSELAGGGDANRLLIQISSCALPGPEKLVQKRMIDRPENRFVMDGKGDRDTESWEPMGIVGGPI